MKHIFLMALLCLTALAWAQPNDNFEDGELLQNPTWFFNADDFFVNTQGELQSNSNQTNHTFQIVTFSTQTGGRWRLRIKPDFETSNNNYIDVFLVSKDSILQDNQNQGYFVRIGESQDHIRLYRKNGSQLTTFATSEPGIIIPGAWIDLVVQKSPEGMWSVEASINGNQHYLPLVQDTTNISCHFFGISIRQSTASFFGKHYFDDIESGPFIADTTPPQLQSANAIDAGTLLLQFDEPIVLSGFAPEHFYIDEIGFPISVQHITNRVELRFAQDFPERTPLTIAIQNIKDRWENETSLSHTFYYIIPRFGDVVLHEFMADPVPVVQFPDVEWIELYNNCGYPLTLDGWRICNAQSCSSTLPSLILPADSFVVVTHINNQVELRNYVECIGVPGFPTLANERGMIQLKDANGNLIHMVQYEDNWYDHPIKKLGGWSLEMKDPNQHCINQGNWAASTDPKGATPGKVNSVRTNIEDGDAPKWWRTYVKDSMHVLLYFSEPISPILSTIAFEPTLAIERITLDTPYLHVAIIHLRDPIQQNIMYELSVDGWTDCAGNAIGFQTQKVALGERPQIGDVIINEILFNPPAGGSDYVELFNRSTRVVDLKYLLIANTDAAGEINSIVSVAPDGWMLLPNEYVLISKNSSWIQRNYICLKPSNLWEVSNLPSYTNTSGTVVIFNDIGDELDRVQYQEDWHYPLLRQYTGVSLERVDTIGFSNDRSKWHSASSVSGYGTPGYQNSQHHDKSYTKEHFRFSTLVISPDNDGLDDYVNIEYTFPTSGYSVNLFIFDSNGHLVRRLYQNIIAGTHGTWRWDGLGEKNRRLPSGRYIFWIEWYQLSGRRSVHKQVFTLINR